jgi:hypothetical protein
MSAPTVSTQPFGQGGLVHPQPAAIQKVRFERPAGHSPAPRQRSGNQGFDIAPIDLGANPMPGAIPEDLDEGERALVPSQKNVPVCLIGVPEAVLGIVDGNGLTTRRQRLEQAAESFIVEI